MLYAKVIYTGVADHSSASDRMTTLCADRFDFSTENGQALMRIHRGGAVETMELTGDVWVMNESGRTISHFAVPFSHLGKDENGEAGTRVVTTSPSVRGRSHE
jgi:hypothetical protein